MLWSLLAFLSNIIGFISFGLSSSFKHLFGDWNRLNLILYIIAGLITSSIVLVAKKTHISRSFMVKSLVGFLVLMLTSLCSYFYDRSMNGKPDAYNIISCAAFAFMSLCFSRKMELGFEAGIFNFFLGFLAVQLMKINLVLASVAAVLCYSLIVIRSYLDSQLEIRNRGASGEKDSVNIVIDATNGVEPDTTEEAALAYDKTAYKLRGDFARLNFPNLRHQGSRVGGEFGESSSSAATTESEASALSYLKFSDLNDWDDEWDGFSLEKYPSIEIDWSSI